MTRTIYVPDDAEGDETLCELIPALHRVATGEQNQRRSRES